MAWRIADRGMAKSIAHSGQFFNFSIQLIRLSQKQSSINFRPFGGKHFTDLIKRETGATPQSD